PGPGPAACGWASELSVKRRPRLSASEGRPWGRGRGSGGSAAAVRAWRGEGTGGPWEAVEDTRSSLPFCLRGSGFSAAGLEQEEPETPVNAGPSSNEDPSLSSSTQNSVAPELPGFYYDPEKNRYFRLLPGHNNHNPLTKDSIQHKAMECKRLRLLEEEEKQIQKTTRAGLNSSVLLQKRQLGLLSSTSYCRLVHELKVNCMQRRKIEIHSPDSSVAGTNNFKIIVADVACERIFTVNDVEHGGCKYGIINLSGLGKESLTVEMYDNLYFTNRKLCLMGIAETPGCASLLPASLFSSTNPGDRPGMLCSFKISTAWSCAWCLNPQADNCFSTGLTRRVLVTNVVTGHRQTFGTSSDVLAQQFATQTPVLYNGCRSGEIFSIDVRQRNRKGQSWKAIRLFHGSAVTSLHLMEAEHYLMAADMAGKLVRIATLEFGVSKMLICLEPSLLPTHHPKMPFLVWCFLQDLGVAEEFLAYSWLSNRISTTSPITDIFSSDLVYKTANLCVNNGVIRDAISPGVLPTQQEPIKANSDWVIPSARGNRSAVVRALVTESLATGPTVYCRLRYTTPQLGHSITYLHERTT
ncbi:DDB1- and CUL4-associated factor 4, partial [Lamprotornis superbus]